MMATNTFILYRNLWRTCLFSALGFIFWIVGPTGVNAQTPAPITLEWKVDIKFGKAASDVGGPGTIIIDPVANSRTVTGAAFDFGGTWKRGKLVITGEPKAKVNVYFPASYTLTNNAGTFSITVNNVTMNKTNPFKLNNSGKKNVFFGGTLQIATNQKGRNYKVGGFTITVEYN